MEKKMEDDSQAAREDAEFQAREMRLEATYRRQNAMELAIKLNHPGAVSAEVMPIRFSPMRTKC